MTGSRSQSHLNFSLSFFPPPCSARLFFTAQLNPCSWKILLPSVHLLFSLLQDLSVVKFLVDESQITDWQIEGLPSDDHSVQNGIIITRTTKYPLLVDPQGQGLQWLRSGGPLEHRWPTIGALPTRQAHLRAPSCNPPLGALLSIPIPGGDQFLLWKNHQSNCIMHKHMPKVPACTVFVLCGAMDIA